MARVFALKVTQPIGEFYVTVLPAKDVVGRVRNRPRSSASATNEDVQRIFSKKRVKDIAAYTEDADATFPTPIILSVTSDRVQEVGLDGAAPAPGQVPGAASASNSVVMFDIPDDNDLIGDVLDGQHRVLGLLHSKFSEGGDFDVVVVLMFDLDPDDKAYVFSIINSKQTPVSSSLIYDLFDLAEVRSPQKTCHFVAQAMNRQRGGPFYQRLKMLGKKEPHHDSRVMLSQGSFAARLEELITKDASRDARLEKEQKKDSSILLPEEPECLLRKYYLRKEDETILKIMQNFFEAARGTFSEQWESDTGEYVIRKTVGYTALMKVLRLTLPEAYTAKDLSLDFFKEKFKIYKANLGDTILNSVNFPSSNAGADALVSALYRGEKPSK
ncbi:MAG: DGQHR domain-containing protein [Burkholderiales bacterium]